MPPLAHRDLLAQIRRVSSYSLTWDRKVRSPSLIFFCRDEEVDALVRGLGIDSLYYTSGGTRKRCRDPRGRKWKDVWTVRNEDVVKRLFGHIERSWVTTDSGLTLEIPNDMSGRDAKRCVPALSVRTRYRARIVVGERGHYGSPRLFYWRNVFGDGYGELEVKFAVSVTVNGIPRV
eukprot:TRINITY_DN8544_c0_g1_i1.p1 TRINITY_DN8544_c0_g1~~TRINITY_DN8544_c0_g1_i1.p1  ORF type:complete len:176 (+),score=8.36 TRINITY_DN8544_c0_g1_i1:134-661(+)